MASLSDFLSEWNNGSPFIDAHTSGSTGKPKHIRLSKADMRLSARATNAFFGIKANSVLASPLSFDYIAGKMMAVRAAEAGCSLIELPVSNSITLPDDPTKINLLPVVPSQLESLARQPEYAARIDFVLIGGAAPSYSQCRQITGAGYKAFISYGMTETCSHVALANADDEKRIFKAMPGIEFETDCNDRLVIIAPHLSFGRLATNDIVELVDRHSFRWRGRADGVINSGGIKLFPEELEALYAPVAGSRPFYVCGTDHPSWGNAVMLVLEGETDIEEMGRRLRETIADTRRLPKIIRTVASLPRTENGKIRRIPPPES